MTNKKKTVSILAGIVLVGSVFGMKPAYAATDKSMGGNFFSGFISFISQKFGLNKTQVQTAMQDYRKQAKATITPRPTMTPQQRQDQEKKRLDPLVSQGKITQEQENEILAEMEVIRVKYLSETNETQDQKKTQMANLQNELKTWAESKGISIGYVMPAFGRGQGPGEGRGRMGFRPSVTP